MRIDSIILDNIKSHKHTELEFQSGINIILGHNGSGKSSIIEALELALFRLDKNIARHSFFNGLIRKGCDSGRVEVNVSNNSWNYKVIAHLSEKTSTNKFKLEVYSDNLEVEDPYSTIKEDILGIHSTDESPISIFENIIGSKQGFMDKPFLYTNSIRKSIFDKILKLDTFNKLKKQLYNVNNIIIKNKLNEHNIKIHTLEEQLNDYPEDLLSLIKEKTGVINNLEENYTKTEKEINETELVKKLIDNMLEQKKYLELEKTNSEKSLQNNNDLLTKNRNKLQLIEKSEKFLLENYDKIERYKELKALFPKIKKQKEEAEQNQKMLVNFDKEITKLNSHIHSIEKEKEYINNSISENTKELKTIEEENSHIKSDLKPLDDKYDKSRLYYDNITRIYEKIEYTFHTIENLKNTTEQELKQIEVLETQIDNIETLKEDIETEYIRECAEKDRIDKALQETRIHISNIELNIKNKEDIQEKIQNDMCPIFNTLCPLSKDDKGLKHSTKDILKELKNNKQNLGEKLAEYERKRNRIHQIEKEIEFNNEKKKEVNDKFKLINYYYENIVKNLKKFIETSNNMLEEIILEEINELKLKNIITNYIDSFNHLKKYINTNCDSYENLSNIFQIIKDFYDSTKLSLEMIKTNITSIKKDIDEIEKAISNSNNKLSNNIDIYNKLARKNITLEAQVSECSNNLTSYNTKLSEVKNNLNILLKTYNEGTHEKIDKEYKEIDKEINILSNINEKAIIHHSKIEEKETLINENEQIKHVINNLKETIQQKEINLSKLNSDLSNYDIKSCEKKLKSLRSNIENILKSIENEKHLLKNLKDKKDKKKQIMKDLKENKQRKNRIEKTQSVIQKIAKDILQETSKRIAYQFINKISAKAGEIYEFLAPEENRRLIWCSDYNNDDIYKLKLQSKTNPNDIIDVSNISGGQLMSASLSLRLALMSMYSYIGVGFLDEPTIFLDSERKTNLAETIKNNNLEQFIAKYKWMDQLFIITHEESFQEIVDNVTLLELDNNNMSKVVENIKS